jgi:cephalosporin-C deacetylase-like acetyl esterase
MHWVLVLALAAPAGAFAQYLEALTRPILPEPQRRSMMYAFVERNLAELPVPATRTAWEAQRAQLRERILRSVGLPDLDRRAPVRWSSKGTIAREGYTIEKILYESYPGMWVPALVYTPEGLSAPAPAMVSIPGHNYCDGKAGPTVQARSVNLARRGVIVLAYDYVGTFERNTGANACAGSPYGGGNDHGHTQFSYFEGTPTALEILDGVRAIDYLYTRRDVDRRRVGFTGESGGGNSTYWVSALDDRVRLSVPVASVTSFDYWIRNDRNWDWHQRPAGIRAVADIWTLLAMVAPRPLLAIASRRGTDSDEFPLEEAERTVARAAKVYALYGAEPNIRLWESDTSHGYQQDKREQMYGWVSRHFLGREAGSSPEQPFLFEPQSELHCGLPEGNQTLAAIYRNWAERSRPAAPPEKRRAQIAELLGASDPVFQPWLRVENTQSREDAMIHRMVLAASPGIELPVVGFEPRAAASSPAVLLLGKGAEYAPLVVALLRRGLRVLAMDLRGTGEIEPGGRRTDNWAWFAGRPWPGMWVEDIRALVATVSPGSIGVAGIDRFGKAALFAAALDQRIAAVLAHVPGVSYRQEMERRIVADVPRILSVADVPEIAALIAPRVSRIETGPQPPAPEDMAAWFEKALR